MKRKPVPKPCKECRWYLTLSSGVRVCDSIFHGYYEPVVERMYGACGPSGKLFEEKKGLD
jgi:hypothetical protein